MSVLIRFAPPSLTAAQYDKVVARLTEEGVFPADGLDYEICFGSEGKPQGEPGLGHERAHGSIRPAPHAHPAGIRHRPGRAGNRRRAQHHQGLGYVPDSSRCASAKAAKSPYSASAHSASPRDSELCGHARDRLRSVCAARSPTRASPRHANSPLAYAYVGSNPTAPMTGKVRSGGPFPLFEPTAVVRLEPLRSAEYARKSRAKSRLVTRWRRRPHRSLNNQPPLTRLTQMRNNVPGSYI